MTESIPPVEPVKVQPAERQPEEQQPAELQPVESQRAERQPVESQPAERQPVEQQAAKETDKEAEQTTPATQGAFQTNWTESVKSFEELNLKEPLLRGIFGFGFEKPSQIQQSGILPIIKQRDTIAQAQSGTGKTGTFAIASLQLVEEDQPQTQILVLSPTRELAIQTTSVFQCLGEFMSVKIYQCTGGTNVHEDKANLKEGQQIVVGTPGRVYDMIEKNVLQTQFIKLLVLDEADEMLSRGFKEQIQNIVKQVPGDVQIALFSATMADEALEITSSFMRDPAIILVKKEELTLEGIKQFYISIEKEDWKLQTLLQLYSLLNFQAAIIYVNTKTKTTTIAKALNDEGFVVSVIHGELEQAERSRIMREFRTGLTRVLIATDLLARGIDVQQVTMVINFDLPLSKEKYIHRIGRSGRFGRQGVALNFVTPAEAKSLSDIEKHYNTKIEEMPLDVTKMLE